MKSELGTQQNHQNNSNNNSSSNHKNSNNNSNHSQNANNNNSVVKTTVRKTAVHDLTQVIAEDCTKLINESNILVSKYHTYLLNIGSGEIDTVQFRDELKLLRKQVYDQIIAALDKLIPQFDQISTKDNEVSVCIQNLVAYLEYLKLEFVRNLYLINSFTNDSMQKFTGQSGANDKLNNHSKNNYFSNNSYMTTCSEEAIQIEKDVKEVESRLFLLTQKYYTYVPDIEEIKLTNKINEKSLSIPSSSATTRLFSKCRLICCLCSPKYL